MPDAVVEAVHQAADATPPAHSYSVGGAFIDESRCFHWLFASRRGRGSFSIPAPQSWRRMVMSRAIRHQLQGRILDDETVASVVLGIARFAVSRKSTWSRSAISSTGSSRPAANALALGAPGDAHRLQVPVSVGGMKARAVPPGLHERSKSTRTGARRTDSIQAAPRSCLRALHGNFPGPTRARSRSARRHC